MTHSDPKIQALLEAIHSMLRSLSDRQFGYEVQRTLTAWEIRVHCGSQCVLFTASAEHIEGIKNEAYENFVRSIALEIIVRWIHAFKKPVDSGTIHIWSEPIRQAIPDATGDPT